MQQPAPSAQIVGQEFVKQYYTMLNAAPEHLHRFYSNNSNFVHGGMDGRPDEQQAVTGQAEIHKKIMSLNFHNCHARICQVDCQSSVGGSVVVQVIGELSNNGQPMHKFVQSFVLAPQSAKKYYVHVDIFRYQDAYPLTTESEPQPRDQCVEELGVTDAAIDETLIDSDVQQNIEPPMTEQPAHDSVVDGANGELPDDVTPALQSDNAVTVTAADADDEQVDEDVKPADDSTAPADLTTGNSDGDDVEAAEDSGKHDQLTEAESTGQPVAEAKPMTWAAMASRKASGSSTVVTAATSNSAVRHQAVPDANQPSKTAWSPSAGVDDRGVNGGRVMVNGGNKDDVTPRRSASSASVAASAAGVNYPDNQQVFVGNLPQHLTDHDLIEFFEQYGKVLDFRINRKTGGQQSGNNVGQKNFGFMAFESPDTVQKVLSERPIYLRKHRLNIEEKKPKEELAAARLSSVRGGGSGGRRGGYSRIEVRSNVTDETRTY